MTVRLSVPPSVESSAPAGVLFVEETATPFGESDGYVPGIRRAVHIMLSQKATNDRHGLTGLLYPPHADDEAMICTHLLHDASTRQTLRAIRAPDDDTEMKGCWQIDCADDAYDHEDAANQAIMHLRHAAEAFPFIVQYLALPGDSAFTVKDGKVAVFRPGDEEYQFDPGDPLSWRP